MEIGPLYMIIITERSNYHLIKNIGHFKQTNKQNKLPGVSLNLLNILLKYDKILNLKFQLITEFFF